MRQPVPGLIRSYKTAGDRRRAMTLMLRGGNYNYFVGYHDTSFPDHPFALNYGWADWVVDQPYMNHYDNEARRDVP